MPSPSIPDEISIFDQSSPESLRVRALSPQLHDQTSSTSDEQTSNVEYDFPTYKQARAVSSRSSISSFPGSVIHTTLFTDTEDVRPHTPSRSQSYDRTLRAPGPNYLAAFRNPSSVRALQLESEWADSDTSSSRLHSKRSPKLGSRSPGSAHSSPVKRLSRPATPKLQSKLKKEFPLVLLHCSLLPPALTAYGPPVADEILQAVLPEQYRKRWKTLQDKVVKNNEVKQRGVLIPHPREDYELLEERLLESLELERPRIRRGHFLGRKSGDSDSGFESSSQNGTDEASDTEENQGSHERCSDCGTAVSRKVVQERYWEVKVFAANGLMKSGAWSAAWEEMEKVDVEVGIWMPEDVRTEVEERLKALQALEEAERPVDPPLQRKGRDKKSRNFTAKVRHDERMREIYGEQPAAPTQEEIDGLADTPLAEPPLKPEPERSNAPDGPDTIPEVLAIHRDLAQEDFLSYMKRHARVIVQDQRNLAIVLLSMLVLMFAFQNIKMDSTTLGQTSVSAQNTTVQLATSPNAANSQVSYVTEAISAFNEALSLSTASPLSDETIYNTSVVKSAEIVPETMGSHLEHDSTTSDVISPPLEPDIGTAEALEQTRETLFGNNLRHTSTVCTNLQNTVLQRLVGSCSI